MNKKIGAIMTCFVLIVIVVSGAFYVRSNRIASSQSYYVSESSTTVVDKTNQEHDSFISKVARPAMKLYEKNQQVLPSIVVAQAILESSWGDSDLYRNANNPFGIMGSYHGQSIRYDTAEVISGKRITVKAAFRKYPSLLAAINDHNRLLAQQFINQSNVLSYRKVAKLLQQNGYATDPHYAKKLIQIIRKYNLSKYDLAAINGNSN
ncbi:glucosaminidase domain-containing protein [Lentilactobacillus senioris]|uniref:glycoside hydrolase family 73 protein n=1 Tax=Lentilactobacillus senioris TaxID=931534 RepID=UPI002281EB4A|nr:glucosaminidase domain-containing protein [Lentilactobacillus senioris]MCY9806312.1 glucosaminidase domain-containing protein [Lentilactobacillus senioris]